ncbi:MAG TPA: T9SS type A sorting domain-containing protein, partial [Bacteroidetes bacterium]|nr:T9SS type A sorting domain-containing protein [Bacteroidota bacterium]
CGDGLDSKTAHTTIRRCVVANNRCDGVKLWADSSAVLNTLIYGRGDGDPQPTPWAALVIDQVEQPGAHFEITNVTIDDSLGQNYLVYVQYGNPVPVEVKFRNCIFSARGPGSPIYVNEASRLEVNYCLFYFPRSASPVVYGNRSISCSDLDSLGTGNFCANPLFVRTAWGDQGDYHLLPGSPAIDAGDPSATWNDADGSRNDLGAFGGPGPLLTSVAPLQGARRGGPTRFELLTVHPNPAWSRITIRSRLAFPAPVRVALYDILGRRAMAPTTRRLTAGYHEFSLDVAALPAGVYVLHVRAGSASATRKFCVVR